MYIQSIRQACVCKCMPVRVYSSVHLLTGFPVSSNILPLTAHTARIVRCQEDTYQHQLLMEKAENLGSVYDALNYVSSCPWKINSKVSWLRRPPNMP